MANPCFSSLLRRHTLDFALSFHRLRSAFTSLTAKCPSKTGFLAHPKPPPHQCKYMRASNNHARTGATRRAPAQSAGASRGTSRGGGGGGDGGPFLKRAFLLVYIYIYPLCKSHDHTTQHLFSCPIINTTLTARDLWDDPVAVAALLLQWDNALGAAEGGEGS